MRPLNVCKFRKQQGQVFIIVALSLVALIGSVGLAVDSGLGYMVKAKLNAAVDSASIAAARAVTQGQHASRAKSQCPARRHRKFFAANYPAAGYLGSTPSVSQSHRHLRSWKPGSDHQCQRQRVPCR